MNRLLQDNPVGLALAGTGAFLVLCMLLIAIGSFLPLSDGEPGVSDLSDDSAVNLPELAESLPVENYSVIAQRPLFNESRLPVSEADPDPTEPGEEVLLADDADLEVELSGVIITPTLRIATLKRTDGSKSLVAIEGKLLEGEFGSWQLTQVESRSVTLVSGSGKELQLQLQVHDERIEPPVIPVKAPEEAAGSKEDQQTAQAEPQSGEALSRAEEIRQRIAERREQLRQEAEDQAGEENVQPTYEEAIRAMINRRPVPKEKPESENEQ